MGKMMYPNEIDYTINCTIPLIITIENRYHIDFDKPACRLGKGRRLTIPKPTSNAKYNVETF